MNEAAKTNGGAVAVADDGANISAYLDTHAGGTTYTLQVREGPSLSQGKR